MQIAPDIQKQMSVEFWAPQQVLHLMRLTRQEDIAQLAKHPLARSKAISCYLQRSGMTREQYNIGLAIFNFVTTLISGRLEELRRSVSHSNAIAHVMASDSEGDLPSMQADASSNSKELKRWSLLAHHYVYKVPIEELSNRFAYSTRQIQYELKSARDELSRILFEQEGFGNITSIGEGTYATTKKREADKMSSEEKELLLYSMTATYSAPCSAFLWGDWSVLISKRGILVPINKRVTVGLKPSPDLGFRLYFWSDKDEKWVFDERHSAKMAMVISEGWAYLWSLVPALGSSSQYFQIYAFSEVPFGSGVHERAATTLCLAACINDTLNSGALRRGQIEQIAGILESFWYPQISWGPIICSSRSPNLSKVMVFDRTNDGNIDFGAISDGDERETKRNLLLSDDAFKVNFIDFDLTRIIPLSHKLITLDLDEVHKLYSRTFGSLRSIGFESLFELLVSHMLRLDYEKVGIIMNLHQDILSAYDLTSSEFNGLLNTLRYERRILGVKPSCCLTSHSAMIALTDGNSLEIAEELMHLVQPIAPFLSPTAGLIKVH